MSSEWWYIQQWNSNQKKIWAVLDSKNKIHLPKGEFTNRSEAEELCYSLKQGLEKSEMISYAVVHNQSREYLEAKEKQETNNVD